MIKDSPLKEYIRAHDDLSIMYGVTSETCASFRSGEQEKEDAEDLKSSIQTLEVFREAMATTRLCSPIKSMKLCGRTPIPSCDIKTNLRIYKNSAFLSGNTTCDSCWCPNCMKRNRMSKIERIAAGLEGAFAQGKKAYFLTLTVPRSNDPIQQINDLMSGYKALQDKVYYQLSKQGIKLDFVRSLDITFKIFEDNIYHAHLHIILVLSDDFIPYESYARRGKKEISELKGFKVRTLLTRGKLRYKDGKNQKVTVETVDQLFSLSWHDVMKQKGLKVSLDAQYIEEIEENNGISRYLGKFQGMGLELMNFQHKSGKKDNKGKLQTIYESMGFMELLGYVSKGNHKALQVYQEFICASHGTRVIGFSEQWKDLEKVGIEAIEARLATAYKPKETKFYNSDGDLIIEEAHELLYEREIPEAWIRFISDAEFWLKDRYYVVIDIFPVAAFKAFHLGEIDELETLFFQDNPHENPHANAYLLERFLLKYWKPQYLPEECFAELRKNIFNLENANSILYESDTETLNILYNQSYSTP